MTNEPFDPVSITLTAALQADFVDIAVKAVNRRDMASLRALNAMKIDLADAPLIAKIFTLLSPPFSPDAIAWAARLGTPGGGSDP